MKILFKVLAVLCFPITLLTSADDPKVCVVQRKGFQQCLLDNDTHNASVWLDQGENPNYRMDINPTTSLSPLAIAISHQCLHMLDTLLSSNRRKHHVHMEFYTLHQATRLFRNDLAKQIDNLEKKERNALYRSKLRDSKILERLLWAGLDDKHHKNTKAQVLWNKEAICAAAEFGYTDVFYAYLNKVNLTSDKDAWQDCMLLAQKNERSEKIVKKLLKIEKNGKKETKE